MSGGIVPKRWQDDYERSTPARPQPTAQVTEGAREADKVLYGPKGEVLVRVQDRPFLGFRRDV